VSGKRDLDDFIKLPYRLYKGEPNWVPPLLKLQGEMFSVKHNAFYQHADVQLFLAYKDGRVAGRVTAHIDHEHNRYWSERTGFFGFFECEDDPAAAQALFDAATAWLRARGKDVLRGPMNFSTNDDCGSLIDGFNTPPAIMMPYTHAYYLDLVESAGYAKAKDLFAWRWSHQPVPEGPARMVRIPLTAGDPC
jgi:hypothetical protein